jgi:hypothetical protein
MQCGKIASRLFLGALAGAQMLPIIMQNLHDILANN